jgi:hypothetical protein
MSPVGSEYETFAFMCGGTGSSGDCITGLMPMPEDDTDANDVGDDATLNRLWTDCGEGDLAACDELFWTSPLGSEYETFGFTCGGRGRGLPDCVTEYGETSPSR